MAAVKKLFGRWFNNKMSDETFMTLSMLIVLIITFTLALLFVPNFGRFQNIRNLFTNQWYLIILGVGVTFLLITGNFDMSVGGVIAMTGVLSVYFSQASNVSQNALANGLGLPYGVAIILSLLCAVGIGLVNSFLIAIVKVPSIIVTLGTMMLSRGIAQVVTLGAQRNTSLPASFGFIGSYYLPWIHLRFPVAVMIVVLIIAFLIERKTVVGRRTYLIGANPKASRLSGVMVTKHLTWLYVLSALLAGVTGILMASEYRAGVSSRAMGYEFDALVIALLGGVSIGGGFGSVMGMFLGSLILSVVTSAATGLLLSPDWQFTLKGIIVFLAIIAQRYALDKRKGS